MKIEVIDLRKRFQEEKNELMKSIERVLTKGNLVLTKEVESFEKKICKFIGVKYCLGLNSGTDALMMSLWAAGISKGDEVITSPISFIASASSIIHVGAKPVFVDVKEDLNINSDLIEKAITKKTKAIMPVHWTGRICDMDKIIKIAKKHNLIIIEDAAQAMGSYYKKKHAGTFGSLSAFSTHPLKNLNALGDGGFVITNNKKYYEKIKNDPEKVAERKRKQNEAYQKNREKKLQYAKDYQKRNKEKILEKRRKAREELEKLKQEELKKKIIQEYLENP